MSAPRPLLEVRGVSKSFKGIHAVNGVDETRTETVTTLVEWHPEAPVRRWRWTGNALFSMNGEDELIARRKETTLRLSATVAAHVPALGEAMEKRIRALFLAHWPEYVELLLSRLAR